MKGLDTLNEISELSGSRFADCPLGRAVQETSGEMHTEVQDAPLEQEGLENIYDEIYNRDEDEFTFDEFNLDDARLERYLGYFEPETWERMDMEDKENVVRAFEGYLAEVLDLKHVPKIYFYSGSQVECGSYNYATNVIKMNENRFDNPQEVINTIAHETWHAYQYQRAKHPETRKDALYVANFENYISPKLVDGKWVGFEEYESQLVEAEARAFGKLFVERGS